MSGNTMKCVFCEETTLQKIIKFISSHQIKKTPPNNCQIMNQHIKDIKLNRLYKNLTRSSISKWRFFFTFSKNRHELASHPNRQSFE